MIDHDITVVIPTIPPRADLLPRAVASVHAQTYPASALVLVADPDHTGSAATCNRGLADVHTSWVLFLADDDQLMPTALQLLAEAQQQSGADVIAGPAWIPQRPGHQVDPANPLPPGPIPASVVTERSRLTGTSLMRTEQVRQVGGFEFRRDPSTGADCDDYGLYCKLAAVGATFWLIPETILIWHINGHNTGGRW
jgi:GT2 family glycosyltransferase